MADRLALRVYSAYIKDEPDEVDRIEHEFGELWNAWGISRTAAINKCLLSGIDAEKGKLNPDQAKSTTGTSKRSKAINDKANELAARRSERSRLELLCKELGLEAFIEFCQSNDIDHEDFMTWYKESEIPVTDRITAAARDKRTAVLKGWLIGVLSDGLPHHVDEIRIAALRTGMIQSEDQFDRIQITASRERMSGGEAGHKFWQLPEPEQESE